MKVLEEGVLQVQLSLVIDKVSVDINDEVMLADLTREIASMDFSLDKPLTIGEVRHNIIMQP